MRGETHSGRLTDARDVPMAEPHAGADAVTYAGGACAVLPMHLHKHLQTIRACLSDARLGCMCVCVCVCVHVHMVMLGWCVCMPSVYTFADYDSMLE